MKRVLFVVDPELNVFVVAAQTSRNANLKPKSRGEN